jgi:adenylylsulfate kinase
LVAATSPYKQPRDEVRRQIGRYIEAYVDCPTEKLIQRDSTGKYKKALSGEIPNFIGITEPYEPPTSPEVTIKSDVETVEDSALRIFQSLLDLTFMTGEEMKIITGKKMKANLSAGRKLRAAAAKGARARPSGRRIEKKAAAKGAKRR